MYKLEDFNSSFIEILETLDKIKKKELKIDSFVSLADFLVKIYEQVLLQKDVAKKTLTFMDGITKIPHV